jgi:hypothetical protein
MSSIPVIPVRQGDIPIHPVVRRLYHAVSAVHLGDQVEGALLPDFFLDFVLEVGAFSLGAPQKRSVFTLALLPEERREIATGSTAFCPSFFDYPNLVGGEISALSAGEEVLYQCPSGLEFERILGSSYCNSTLRDLCPPDVRSISAIANFLSDTFRNHAGHISSLRECVMGEAGSEDSVVRVFNNPNRDAILNLDFSQLFQEYVISVTCTGIRVLGCRGTTRVVESLHRLGSVFDHFSLAGELRDDAFDAILAVLGDVAPAVDYAGRPIAVYLAVGDHVEFVRGSYFGRLSMAGEVDASASRFAEAGYDPEGYVLSLSSCRLAVPGCVIDPEVIPLDNNELVNTLEGDQRVCRSEEQDE